MASDASSEPHERRWDGLTSLSARRRLVRLSTLVGVLTALGTAGCGHGTLSDEEERDYDRVLVRLVELCDRAPLSAAAQREASRLVDRAIALTTKAPRHSWVVIPNDRDTGERWTGTALIRVSEILNVRKGGGRCSTTLRARAERAISQLALLK
jgi:hypothetical protein